MNVLDLYEDPEFKLYIGTVTWQINPGTKVLTVITTKKMTVGIHLPTGWTEVVIDSQKDINQGGKIFVKSVD